MIDIVYNGIEGKFVTNDEYERLLELFKVQNDLIERLILVSNFN